MPRVSSKQRSLQWFMSFGLGPQTLGAECHLQSDSTRLILGKSPGRARRVQGPPEDMQLHLRWSARYVLLRTLTKGRLHFAGPAAALLCETLEQAVMVNLTVVVHGLLEPVAVLL